MNKTIICDIDGVLLYHPGLLNNIYNYVPKTTPGTIEKLQEWHNKEYVIILLTARLPSLRKITEQQLEKAHIPYHQLVMGAGRGTRVLINDKKPTNDMIVAQSIELERDSGLYEIDI